MNPWKIIGWIMLGLLLLFLVTCFRVAQRISQEAPSQSRAAPTTPAHRIRLVEVNCRRSNGGMAVIEGTVQNVGQQPVSFVRVYGSFRRSNGALVAQDDSYADADTLAPGQSSPFDILGPRVDFGRCQVDQILVNGELAEIR